LSCGSGRMLWCSVSVFCVGIPAPRSSTPDRETNLPPSRDAPSHGRLVRTWPSPVPSSIAHHAPANTNTTPAQREYEATQPNEESQCGFGRLRESATNSLMLSMIEMTIIVSPIRCSVRAIPIVGQLGRSGRHWASSTVAILRRAVTTCVCNGTPVSEGMEGSHPTVS